MKFAGQPKVGRFPVGAEAALLQQGKILAPTLFCSLKLAYLTKYGEHKLRIQAPGFRITNVTRLHCFVKPHTIATVGSLGKYFSFTKPARRRPFRCRQGRNKSSSDPSVYHLRCITGLFCASVMRAAKVYHTVLSHFVLLEETAKGISFGGSFSVCTVHFLKKKMCCVVAHS